MGCKLPFKNYRFLQHTRTYGGLNKFLLFSVTSSQIWQSPLVEGHKFTYSVFLFDLKNMISIYKKGFLWEKKNPKSPFFKGKKS
jgi:hypothetical protein